MRNKALHTIFPDSATTHSDSPVQTAFANLLPAQQAQFSDSSGVAMSTLSPSSEPFGVTSNASQTLNQAVVPDVLTDVSKNLDLLRAVTESQTAEITANTAALGTNTASKTVGQTVASVGKAASGFLGGLTSFPLISGLVKLFGGGSDTPAQQPALPKYEAPASLTFDRAVSSESGGSDIGEPTYDQFGRPIVGFPEGTSAPSAVQLFSQLIPNGGDPQDPTQSSLTTGISVPDTNIPDYTALLAAMRVYGSDFATQDSATTPAPSASSANGAQITVNVQAMDSRSFLDRSQDIAQAVREAMLNMHSINDVVNDL